MNCAIYIRKSREDKNKPAHRLTVQREQLPAYAKSQGWTPVVYDDGHASAARGKTEDLEQRNRLEKDIQSGKIKIILTIELSRLSRDESMQDYTAWLHLCSQYNVKLATMSRTLDPAQHSDWMLLLMEGGFSSVEMKVLQSRMAEGRREAIKAGKYISGRPPVPYIYDKATSSVKIATDQLKQVEQILTLAETMSVHKIAQETGQPVIKIRRIVSDDRLLFYQGKRLNPDTGETIIGQWDAIIDAARAEVIRSARRTRKPQGQKRESGGLLSNLGGMLQCGYCGRTAKYWRNSRVKADGTRNDYYGCSHSCKKSRLVQMPVVDEKVITNMCGVMGKIPEIEKEWHKKQLENNPADQLAKIDKEEAEQLKKKKRLIEAITEEVINFADAKEIRQQIENNIGALQLRRQQVIASQKPMPKLVPVDSEDWAVMPTTERRHHLSGNIESITLFYAYALIKYRFPRGLDKTDTARIHLPEPYKASTRKPRATKRK